MTVPAVASSDSAPGSPGHRSSISAAPRAANAMGCRYGEPMRALASNRARRSAPSPVVAEAATELPVCRLSPCEKVEVAAAQGDELGGRRRIAAHDHQAVGDVIDAVAALVPGHDPVGALEHADVIGQALEVAERRGGNGRDLHATPEAGSNGLACPLTSRAVAEHPPRPRVVNAQSRYPRTRPHEGRPPAARAWKIPPVWH